VKISQVVFVQSRWQTNKQTNKCGWKHDLLGSGNWHFTKFQAHCAAVFWSNRITL